MNKSTGSIPYEGIFGLKEKAKFLKYRSSARWCKKFGIELGKDILDPDGWDRQNFEQSWNEPITEQEFRTRVLSSTCYFDTHNEFFKSFANAGRSPTS